MLDQRKFPPLNLPIFDPKVRIIRDVIHIHDDIRKKYVVLTPEEWVRQHFVHYLTDTLGYPRGRVMIEYQINYNQRIKRPDIGILSADAEPVLLVECKAPEVALTEAVFLQLATYYSIVGSKYLALTNGLQHVFAEVQPDTGKCVFIKSLPMHL